jgi:hypothetical protein
VAVVELEELVVLEELAVTEDQAAVAAVQTVMVLLHQQQ